MILVDKIASKNLKSQKIADRVNKIKRIFHHEDFDNPAKFKEITADIPDFESYKEEKLRIQKDRERTSITSYMQVCYDEPLLSREQEFHLFRRYNFHKYRAINFTKKRNFGKAETELMKADDCQRLLTSANVRIVIKNIKKFNNNRHYEDIIAESYYLVAKSVDYFDWTRGFKFCTYASWTLKRTLYRNVKEMTKDDYFVSTDEIGADAEFTNVDQSYDQEIKYRQMADFLNGILQECNDRDRMILKSRFFEEKTLNVVGKEMGITKERVRQIESRALERIRAKLKISNISFDDI